MELLVYERKRLAGFAECVAAPGAPPAQPCRPIHGACARPQRKGPGAALDQLYGSLFFLEKMQPRKKKKKKKNEKEKEKEKEEKKKNLCRKRSLTTRNRLILAVFHPLPDKLGEARSRTTSATVSFEAVVVTEEDVVEKNIAVTCVLEEAMGFKTGWVIHFWARLGYPFLAHE